MSAAPGGAAWEGDVRIMSGRRTTVALVCGGVLSLAGAGYGYQHRGYTVPSSTGTVPVSAPVAATPSSADPDAAAVGAGPSAPATPARSVPAAAAVTPGRPVRLVLADIGADAPVVPVGVQPSGALDIPANPRVLGWWEHGARPGERQGSVVVVGHVDSAKAGKGALFHLGSARLGSTVTVTTTRGTVHYRVVARRVYEKADLPQSVFATVGDPRLVLITCGGPFNRATRHYRDNVVVYAVPA